MLRSATRFVLPRGDWSLNSYSALLYIVLIIQHLVLGRSVKEINKLLKNHQLSDQHTGYELKAGSM